MGPNLQNKNKQTIAKQTNKQAKQAKTQNKQTKQKQTSKMLRCGPRIWLGIWVPLLKMPTANTITKSQKMIINK